MASGVSPLAWAAKSGLTDLCRRLISAGADPEAEEPLLGRTPLLWAAANGHAETCQALVDAGAVLNARDNAGAGAWQWGLPHTAVRSWLAQTGADPNLADENGHAPLHHAASYGTSGACLDLVKAGAGINRPDRKGATALDIAEEALKEAAAAGREEADRKVRVLRLHGAKPGGRLRPVAAEQGPAP